jgi:hypothetical protein
MALLTDQEKTDLAAATNEAEFTQTANAIRVAHNYVLPTDWYPVVVGGSNSIMQVLRATWADPDAFKAGIAWDPIPQAPWPPA